MFIVMAIEAQQLPVAAVGRVVVVVVILMMDREFTELLSGKFASAPGADPGKELERTLPVALFTLQPVFPGRLHNTVPIACIRSGLLERHDCPPGGKCRRKSYLW